VDIATVRVRFAGDGTARPSQRRVGRLNVYRPALASWYGPGLFGNQLGCGGTLNAGTVGVAHKSLPCGTRVVLRKGSRIVRTRVIDRGPYVGAREFDLTQATKQRLGFGSTGTVLVAH
jgi:rare lipoprotein A